MTTTSLLQFEISVEFAKTEDFPKPKQTRCVRKKLRCANAIDALEGAKDFAFGTSGPTERISALSVRLAN